MRWLIKERRVVFVHVLLAGQSFLVVISAWFVANDDDRTVADP